MSISGLRLRICGMCLRQRDLGALAFLSAFFQVIRFREIGIRCEWVLMNEIDLREHGPRSGKKNLVWRFLGKKWMSWLRRCRRWLGRSLRRINEVEGCSFRAYATALPPGWNPKRIRTQKWR